MKVKIEQIETNGNHRPCKAKDEAVKNMALSMGSPLGLLQPIALAKVKGQAKYTLVDGQHRLLAARQLKWTEIEADIQEYDDDAQLIQAIGAANLVRKPTHPLEDARLLKAIFAKEPKPEVKDVATALGQTETWVYQRRRLIGLSEASIKAWAKMVEDDEDQPVAKWEALAIASPEAQAEYLSGYGFHQRDAKQILRDLVGDDSAIIKQFPWLGEENNTSHPFKTEGCVACKDCKTRSDIQADLFAKGEVAGKDARCLNSACRAKKIEHWLKDRIAIAKQDNKPLVSQVYGETVPGAITPNYFDMVSKPGKDVVEALVVAGPDAGKIKLVRLAKTVVAKAEKKAETAKKQKQPMANKIKDAEARLLMKRQLHALRQLITALEKKIPNITSLDAFKWEEFMALAVKEIPAPKGLIKMIQFTAVQKKKQ